LHTFVFNLIRQKNSHFNSGSSIMQTHSDKIQAQLIASALEAAGISRIVISPGSRNAPLIVELTGNPYFDNYSIVDERVAGFFALGMAQQSHKPVVLVCTSGSALLNYYPAIAEAFYSRIPLIVVSADRPQKWVDQGEGQTIRQDKVFVNHSWMNTTLYEGDKHQQENAELITLAIETAFKKQGPVHINVPFDEPLYQQVSQENPIPFSIDTNNEQAVIEEEFLSTFASRWNASKRKMILVGQHSPSEFLQLQLDKFRQDPSVIILTENISNVHNQAFIQNIDRVIFNLSDPVLEELRPEILISVGRNIISKKVKQFLRKHKPEVHWHIEQTELVPNTFEVLTQHFDTTPEMFFSQFLFMEKANAASDYQDKWLKINRSHKKRHQNFINKLSYSDLLAVDLISQYLPLHYAVQWGNSSIVRYAQLVNFDASIQHFANRGTSGIDGSTSTAIGAAFASDRPTLLVTGDISFLYDSNALWNKYIPDDFKIIIINNGGGDIFNFIPGPSTTDALDNYFVTKHRLDASKLAEMYGFAYKKTDNLRDLKKYLPVFFSNKSKPQILEIDTQQVDNASILKAYFNKMK